MERLPSDCRARLKLSFGKPGSAPKSYHTAPHALSLECPSLPELWIALEQEHVNSASSDRSGY